MTVLITGAAGFIGSHLAKALIKKGHSVRGLYYSGRNLDQAQALGIDIFKGNLADPASIKGLTKDIDIVFHLATRTLDWGSRKQFESVMVKGTMNLLKEARGNIKRFIYFSSIAALGIGRNLEGATEDTKQVKTGIPYCDTKIIAENRVITFCTKNNIDFTILRPANVIGPGSVWVREIMDAYKRGPVPLINKGKAPGAFIYIDNLIDGTLLAAESDKAIGNTYHLKDNYSETWANYLTQLGEIVNKKPAFNLPYKLAFCLSWNCAMVCLPFGIRPPFTRLFVSAIGQNHDVDTRRAKQDLGWSTRVDYDTGMAVITKWVREHYDT